MHWIVVNPLLSANGPSAISRGPCRAGGFSDPVEWVSAPFSQLPFPACSEGVYVLHYQEIGRPDVFNSPCSRVLCLLPSHPSSCCLTLGILSLLHPMCSTTHGSSHVPAPCLQVMEQCSCLPPSLPLSCFQLGRSWGQGSFPTKLGTKQNKLVLQRTVPMGITPGNGRLGMASRSGMTVVARDCGEVCTFFSWYLCGVAGFISSCCLGFGLSILAKILTIHHIHPSVSPKPFNLILSKFHPIFTFLWQSPAGIFF